MGSQRHASYSMLVVHVGRLRDVLSLTAPGASGYSAGHRAATGFVAFVR
jgi:hypothetical protein